MYTALKFICETPYEVVNNFTRAQIIDALQNIYDLETVKVSAAFFDIFVALDELVYNDSILYGVDWDAIKNYINS